MGNIRTPGSVPASGSAKGRHIFMRTVIIHGQSHEGSTCLAARELAHKVGGETQEFFLPRDFDAPCLGCYTCFRTDLTHCPHYGRLKPLADAILAADLLIFASPVYVYHATGQMMSFLDHFGTWWVVHRPRPEMANKQEVVIATAAGGGLKSTAKDIADSLEMWGVRKVYRLTFSVQASRPAEVPPRIQERIHAQTGRMARRIQSGAGKTGYNRRAKRWFHLIRFAHLHFARSEPDFSSWEKAGWHGKRRPWTDR